MNEKNKNTDNLNERLEKIIEQKSNENSALNNLLEKIYKKMEELEAEKGKKN